MTASKSLAALAIAATLSLAGCASSGTVAGTAPAAQTQAALIPPPPTVPAPQQTTQTAMAATNVLDFVDPGVMSRLSEQDRAQASSAQFYALQFGRPGAPRAWTGQAGTSGSVSVGPYVRVNSLDCRDFTHTVTVGGAAVSREGTACREADGSWDVVDASTV